MIATVVKQPGETLQQVASFATTAPIAAVVDVAVTPRGLVPGAQPLAAAATIDAGAVTVALSSGVDGERYAVRLLARDATGAELETDIEVVVIETVWAMPDGGAPYLSIDAFVRRVGLSEVVAMTDPDGSGRIDRDLLVEALIDAQAEAESYLGGRFALPLATVPRIVAAAIADRARARLYPRGAPDGVEALAKNALRLLENISAGKVSLGLAEVDAPAAAQTDAPVIFVAGRRQYPDGLADY